MRTLKIIFIIGSIYCGCPTLFAQVQNVSAQDLECIEKPTSCVDEIAQPSVVAVNMQQVITEKEVLNDNVARKRKTKAVRVVATDKAISHSLSHHRKVNCPKK